MPLVETWSIVRLGHCFLIEWNGNSNTIRSCDCTIYYSTNPSKIAMVPHVSDAAMCKT